MLRSADKALSSGWQLRNTFGEGEPQLLLDDRVNGLMGTFSGWGLGPAVCSTKAGLAWASANRAIFIPVRVPYPVTVYQLSCGTGTGTTGNFDLGVYDAAGNRMVSTGSTAKTTASSERIVDVTDTPLRPGLYYLAMVTDGTTPYFQASNVVNIGILKLLGCREMASAFPLPNPATFATVSVWSLPLMAAYLKSI